MAARLPGRGGGDRAAAELLEEGAEERMVECLRADLKSGFWDQRYGSLREMESFEGSLRLVISEPAR